MKYKKKGFHIQETEGKFGRFTDVDTNRRHSKVNNDVGLYRILD